MSHDVLRPAGVIGDTRMDLEHIGAQQLERRRVRFAPRANGDIQRRPQSKRRQQVYAHELAEPTLERVPIDRRVLVKRNDDSNTRKSERGSEDASIEMHGPNSLPLSNDGL